VGGKENDVIRKANTRTYKRPGKFYLDGKSACNAIDKVNTKSKCVCVGVDVNGKCVENRMRNFLIEQMLEGK